MVGFYPQLQEGELLYSATARLTSAIFPGRKVPYCAARLLGSPHATFGHFLPNNVTKLIENIPEVSALTEEAALNASLFHLISPLLVEVDRAELRQSIFVPNSTLGLRTFNARGAPTVLKYCVNCARTDADLGKPAIWRTVQNHYGAIACAKHGLLLEISKAPIGRDTLCAPADWIDLEVESKAATDAEIAMARDFEWIHAQRSSFTPGPQAMVARLREIILSRSDFIVASGFINNASLLKAARNSISGASQHIFAPNFRQLASGRGLSIAWRTTLQAYSLYAHITGTSLKEVLTDLAKPSGPPKLAEANRESASSRRILFYKGRLDNFVRENPHCTRSQIIAVLANAVAVVRSADPQWFERHMPKSLSSATGAHGSPNWDDRDTELCSLISKFVAKNGPLPFRSFRDALIKLNQPCGLLIKAKGRLPKAYALLESLLERKQLAA